MLHTLLLLASFQHAGGPAIARVTIEPGDVAVQVGDSVRLSAVAHDSAGRPVREVTVRWFQAGGVFEGRVDSTGLVRAGSVGTLAVSALVAPRGGGSPTTAFARVAILPRPAGRIAIEPAVARLYAGQSVVLSATPYSPDGDARQDEVAWSSDAPQVVSVSADGRLSAGRPGRATVTAKAGRAVERLAITVVPNPVVTVAVEPARASVRAGDVIRFTFQARTGSGQPVADATPEWSIAPGSGQVEHDGTFVADLPGKYRVVAAFAGKLGEAVVEVRSRDTRRPTTLVGRLPLPFPAAEFWLHPDGKHGYITTMGDRVYALDLSDPARPAVTDSVVVDARHINDVMTTEDGKYGVLTRENASTRKNGIVILSFEDPAHPRPIAEFTETVSGGVHSTFIHRGYIYLTDDATGSLRVIDLRDPYKPRQVARWETPSSSAGNYVHDVDVKDGLAYLSYWNDGLIILDVGNGIAGGSPEQPKLVSQYKYDLEALYRDVELVGGPGFIRGTHTAWRQGKYVFVGDEVFSAAPRPTEGSGVVALGRAYGRLHVVDVSDVRRPRGVAYYEPKDGGAHNVWVAGDTLYLGDYQGGLRVVDISGELRGDLLRQGREIAHVATADANGVRPFAPNAWGAVYRDGLIYVPDINTGLWIVRVDSKPAAVP